MNLPGVAPTIVLEDTSALAQYYLNYQAEHPEIGVVQFPLVAGWLTYLGALIFAAAGGVAWFSAALLQGDALGSRWRAWLLVSGGFAWAFCIDDLFMIHEQLNKLGEAWEIAYLLLGGTATGVLLSLSRVPLTSPARVALLLAIVGMIGSQGWEIVVECAPTVSPYLPGRGEPMIQGCAVVEEGLKLLGIVCWGFLCVHSSKEALARCARDNKNSRC
jgi:hypothetical protein